MKSKLPKVFNMKKLQKIIPKKIPKIKKKHKKPLYIGILIFALVFTSGALLFQGEESLIRDIALYSDIEYTVKPSGVELESGDLLQAQVHDVEVKLTWTSTSSNPHILRCTLKGVEYAEGAWVTETTGKVYTWTFRLDTIPVGTFNCHFEFTGYFPDASAPERIYMGDSFNFQINNLIEVTEDPDITTKVDDMTIGDEMTQRLTWRYNYASSSTLTLHKNGVLVRTQAGIDSITDQVFQEVIGPLDPGTYTYVFSINPGGITIPTTDTAIITVVPQLDFETEGGLPSTVECNVEVTGTISTIGLPSTQIWNARSTAPGLTPLQGIMKVVLHCGGAFSDADLFVYLNGEHVDTIQMNKFLLIWWVDIDLDSMEAGEYTFEARCHHDGTDLDYKVTSFVMAVRVFPTAWVLSGVIILTLVSVGMIFLIIIVREVKGWWGFQGKYSSV